MAHMIDETTGRAAIAYVGEKPWHGLGAELQAGTSIEEWRKAAGLDWTAERAPVMFVDQDFEARTFGDRFVLYRSDTKAPLSVVSERYKPVQPADVLDFFGKISEAAGWQLETAGALSGGRRIWGLAKAGEGAEVKDGDIVKPYVLLATSFDGTLATTARFTSVRVVCHNTISISVAGKAEVTVCHSAKFDGDAVRKDLGIFADAGERFIATARKLAAQQISAQAFDLMAIKLINDCNLSAAKEADEVRKSRAYRDIAALFNGGAIGSELCAGTAWQFVNAATEYCDHQRGRSADTRMASAWFGKGRQIKGAAFALAAGIAGAAIDPADEAPAEAEALVIA